MGSTGFYQFPHSEAIGTVAPGIRHAATFTQMRARFLECLAQVEDEAKLAVEFNPMWTVVFHPLQNGRRCSCFDVEAEPSSICPCCYGISLVGGYEKYGCHTELIDVTHPNIRTVNVFPNYDAQTRPVHFALMQGAQQGFLEAQVVLGSHKSVVDLVELTKFEPTGTEVRAYIKSAGDADYVLLTEATLLARLGRGRSTIRIWMWRPSALSASPKFHCLRLRYWLQDDIRMPFNKSSETDSKALAEFGVEFDFASMTLWTDGRPENFTHDDLIYQIAKQRLWKVFEINPHSVEGVRVGYDLQVRFIRATEGYRFINMGRIPEDTDD